MTRLELIMEIKDELRGSSSLPYSIPDKEIERLIDKAKKWFYRQYADAVESKFYVIPTTYFESKYYKNTKTIDLPKCVISVYECREINGGKWLGFSDADFSENRLIASEIYLGLNSDEMVLRTAQMAFWDLSKAFMLDHVAYDFNRNTNRMKIKGRTPDRPLFLRTYIEIPEEALFDDHYFIDYTIALAKKSLGRILGFFEYQLPGGITVNSADIKSEGEEELQKIEEEIRENDVPDWFLIFH